MFFLSYWRLWSPREKLLAIECRIHWVLVRTIRLCGNATCWGSMLDPHKMEVFVNFGLQSVLGAHFFVGIKNADTLFAVIFSRYRLHRTNRDCSGSLYGNPRSLRKVFYTLVSNWPIKPWTFAISWETALKWLAWTAHVCIDDGSIRA